MSVKLYLIYSHNYFGQNTENIKQLGTVRASYMLYIYPPYLILHITLILTLHF